MSKILFPLIRTARLLASAFDGLRRGRKPAGRVWLPEFL